MADWSFDSFRGFSPYKPRHEAPSPWGSRPLDWTVSRRTPFPDLPPLMLPVADAGTTSFIGRVVSGSGANYRVTIYDQGPQFDSTIGDVEVTILMISRDDQIPEGTWLCPVMQFVDGDGNETYFAQPPVWMD